MNLVKATGAPVTIPVVDANVANTIVAKPNVKTNVVNTNAFDANTAGLNRLNSYTIPV